MALQKRKFKRVLAIGDTHCAHRVGLTHPDYLLMFQGGDHFDCVRREMWYQFAAKVKELGKIDVLLVNGDCIEGKGERSGGTELLTSDRTVQADMATAVIQSIHAEKIIMTFGTPYHTGKDEDWESVIATRVGARIGGHEWFDVNGTVFDAKHFITGTSVPYGAMTPLAKDHVWNSQWWLYDEHQPLADIILRSHVHKFNFAGDEDYLAITLPALQGLGSKFGSRKCSGKVSFGFVYFDCYEDGTYTWHPWVLKIREQRAEVVKC